MVLLTDLLIVYSYYRIVKHFIAEQPINISADAGIVFFGDYNDNQEKIGPDSENRAMAAINLYQKGKIKSIICVGGYAFRRWKENPHLMKNYLLEHGVPEKAILHDTLSFNTMTNWQEACKIIKQNKFKKVIAISAPLHIYRISKMIESDEVYYYAYTYQPDNFHEYWQIFKDIHHEWVSIFLSFTVKDRIRNRIVYIYRVIRFELDNVLYNR